MLFPAYNMSILNKFFRKKQKEQLAAVQGEPVRDEKNTRATRGAAAPAAGASAAPLRERKTGAYAPGVIVSPLVSEKAVRDEKHGTYTFIIDRRANSTMVVQAIEAMYGVRPSHVRVVNMPGKRVRFGGVRGQRGDWKKAMVTLPKGQTISIHEGV